MHQIEGGIDLFQRHGVGDQIVNVDLAFHVPVDDLWNICASARASKSAAFPYAPGYQLEWSCRYLLAGLRDTDNDRFTQPR